MENIIALVAAYFVGSIPFGLLLTKIFGKKDIRQEGSGNIGATNVVRVAGKKLGMVTFALDALKAVFALVIALYFLKVNNALILNCVVGLTVVGHCFPLWLKFKGGKGVATFLGGLVFYNPGFALLIMLGWYIFFYITRIVSVASIVIMLAISVFYLLDFNLDMLAFILTPWLVIYMHRENIKRIIAGTESSFKK